mmetsp:Transcript_115704/g.230660  ORF Transcript_115704/g.230660 Transcript_115704/m.230660 type:complete len:367 (-) Transcript_115704:81-1181(-)
MAPEVNGGGGGMLAPPPCRDLGVMEGPVLVFGGAYSNLQALEAILKLAKDELHIPAERIIHTGDVVAYCAQPRQTTECLRVSGVHCLMGNCEESIGAAKTDCGCGFPEDSACNAYSINWYDHVTKELVGRSDLATWMNEMPRRLEFTLNGRRLTVVHGSPRNISEFIWPSTPVSELQACFAVLPENIDGIINGHSGLPYARLVPCGSRQKMWLNAGVIGVPANDGTSRGWYALLTPTGHGGLEISIRSFEYDVQSAADAIYATPQLVRGYADSLLSGVWPSHDILPLEEQMNTGVPLQESTLLWPGQENGSNGAKIVTEKKAIPNGRDTLSEQSSRLRRQATAAVAVVSVGVVATLIVRVWMTRRS